jgi:RNA polymerase primary sigma factor
MLPKDHADLNLYYARISLVPLLTREEELALATKIVEGDMDARNTLVEANLRLVVKVASQYKERGVPFFDLISEGNVGLVKGATKFKPTGAKFSTYAGFWIRQRILLALASQGRTIRLPIHVISKISDILRTQAELATQLGRECTIDELSDAVKIKPNKLINIINIAQGVKPLDAPLGMTDSNMTLGDTIPSDIVPPNEKAESSSESDLLWEGLAILSDRDSDIMQRRYGLKGHEPHTLEKVGNLYGITRERVRQIQNLSLRKLMPFCKAKQKEQTSLDIGVKAWQSSRQENKELSANA